MKYWNWKTAILGLAAGTVLIAIQAQERPGEKPVLEDAEAPALLLDTNAEPKVVQPAHIELPPALAEVVRLAQSGAEESLMVAYVQKAPPYTITGDQIIYLQDLGVSEGVLKAMVEHSQNGAAVVPPALTNTVVVTPPVPRASVAVEAPLTPTAPPAHVSDFYEPLTPYGSWVDIAPYGWCWQPNVVVVNRAWSPYSDRGHWLWTDSGWYWHSDYSWGWAPFHYGRWFSHPHRGWFWAPDRVWGPSWVSWRDSPGYCGWAPLPPGAHFSVGHGWSYHGRRVSHGFSFGLSTPHFTFVARSHFLDRHVHSRAIARREANVVIRNTTVINNYVSGSGNTVINRGIDRNEIERATKTRIREVSVRELPRDSRRGTVPDRVTREGNSEVVYRPGPNIQVPRRPVERNVASLRPSATTGGETRLGDAPRNVTPSGVTPSGSERQRPQRPDGRRTEVPQSPSAVRPNAPVPATPREVAPAPNRSLPQRPLVRPQDSSRDYPPTQPGVTAPSRQAPVTTIPPQPRSIPSRPPEQRSAPPSVQPRSVAPAPVQPRSAPAPQPRSVPRRDENRGGRSAGVPPVASARGNGITAREPVSSARPPQQVQRSLPSMAAPRHAEPSRSYSSSSSRSIERSLPARSAPRSQGDSPRRSEQRR